MDDAQSGDNNFWRKIGKLGISSDRKSGPGQSVRLEDGTISTDPQKVLKKWHRDYDNLFNKNDSTPEIFDEHFLTRARDHLQKYDTNCNYLSSSY